MSFFNYKPPEDPKESSKPSEPYMKIHPSQVVIDGANLIKVVDDNPELPEGKTDTGNWLRGIWNPLNYNPKTGEILK